MAIDSYLNNVTSQHRDKPKFIAWLSAVLTKTDDVYMCVKTFDDEFDIDNAVGKQQDTLGELIGVKRTLDFETDTISSVLDDETYRLVQKARIAQNNWDGTTPKIYELWNNMFDDLKLSIIDNQDMSMTAVIFGSINELDTLLISNGYVVPKPSTVGVTYVGKSDMEFKTYSAMIPCSKTTSNIEMIQPASPPIDITVNSKMIVSSISSTTI